jgi:TPR repeat protein
MSRPIITAAVVAAAVVLIAVAFYVLSPSPTVMPDGRPVTDADRADRARETIAELREESDDGRADIDAAFARAGQHREAGELADAHVLYFFAARNGHAQAAFNLATSYDPLHHSPQISLLQRPNPAQALKYYMQALDGGIAEAQARLDALHEWAELEAPTNTEAEQLLVQWNRQ